MADELNVGDPVTLTWYDPGEPYRPRGKVSDPTEEDLARLQGLDGDRLLVHWRSPSQRRWEHRQDLRRDVDD
jgi:hypothetical protein